MKGMFSSAPITLGAQSAILVNGTLLKPVLSVGNFIMIQVVRKRKRERAGGMKERKKHGDE